MNPNVYNICMIKRDWSNEKDCIEAIKQWEMAEIFVPDDVKETKEWKIFMLEEKVKRL